MLKLSKIMVPIDLHQKSDNEVLVATAVDLAQKFGSELIFLNVVDVDLDSSMISRFDDIKAEYAQMANRQLRDLVASRVPDGIETDVKVLSGRSYSKITATAEELNADLIVIAAHKPGMQDFLLGMTAARVMRHANCSVMVIRADR